MGEGLGGRFDSTPASSDPLTNMDRCFCDLHHRHRHFGRVALTKIEYQEEYHGFVVQLSAESGATLTYVISCHDVFEAITKATKAINRHLSPVLHDLGF